MENYYSFIIPVYNRPQEIKELLDSLQSLQFNLQFEVVIVEDGSSITSKEIVESYNATLNVSYFYKKNTGPGDSRNYGMQKAKGNYFLILDSDVILPKDYLYHVDDFLKNKKIQFFGGPDAAHPSFSRIQKAINYAMTSFLTTGGIRGKERKDYEPRSFNMGISKNAFEASGGFGNIHPGEDPDLSLRLKKMGYHSAFIPNAVVYHKRRIDFNKFFQQVQKFGKVRPILLQWHPKTFKITYFFPTFFIGGLITSVFLASFGIHLLLFIYLFYFFILFVDAIFKNRSILIGVMAVAATIIQFMGYGSGFLESFFKIKILKQNPQKTYPNLFFKNV